MTPVATLEVDGRVWKRRALSAHHVAMFEKSSSLGDAPGVRFAVQDLADLLEVSGVNDQARRLLPGAEPVRIVAFNKRAENNWTLGWHQDRVVALRNRADVAGFDNWSRKAGVWHAEPPVDLLARMIFARVHIDAADSRNGCLEIALGTHRHGKISAVDVAATVEKSPIEECIGEAGDVLFAKALVAHRSRASQSAAPRRAIRIDYCADALPPPLEWEN